MWQCTLRGAASLTSIPLTSCSAPASAASPAAMPLHASVALDAGPSDGWYAPEPATGQSQARHAKAPAFDLNPVAEPCNDLWLHPLGHKAARGVLPQADDPVAAADGEVAQILKKAEQARARWEAAEAELRTAAEDSSLGRLPSLERRLHLPSSLGQQGSTSPGARKASQAVYPLPDLSLAGSWEAGSPEPTRTRTATALAFLTPSLRHLEKAIPEALRARLALYRSDQDQRDRLEERVAFYVKLHPRSASALPDGFVAQNRDAMRSLSPDILLEERRRKLHEQASLQRERLAGAHRRRLVQLAAHEGRLREALARSAKENDGSAMLCALHGTPAESDEQRRKRVTAERQLATSRAWLALVALTSRLTALTERMQERRLLAVQRVRWHHAASVIQGWFRACQALRQQERRNACAVIIQRNFRRWAFVHGLVARQRSALLLLAFLRQMRQANMVTAAFRDFRTKVVRIQRCLKDHCAVSAARQVLVCELWDRYEKDLQRTAQVDVKAKKKVARVRFAGPDAARQGGSKDGKVQAGSPPTEEPASSEEAVRAPRREAEAFVGVSIPRLIKLQVAAAFIEEERREFGARLRAHQQALKAFQKRWVSESKLLAAKLMVQGMAADAMAGEIEKQRTLERPLSPKWAHLLPTEKLAELHSRGLKEATEFHSAKRTGSAKGGQAASH